jgi:hypothetical protein
LMKPLEVRLEEAACIYWECDPGFFRIKHKDGNTAKRRTLFWLLNRDAGVDYSALAARFGLTKQCMKTGVELLDWWATNQVSIRHDIANIRQLAGTLGARVISIDIRLSNMVEPRLELEPAGRIF